MIYIRNNLIYSRNYGNLHFISFILFYFILNKILFLTKGSVGIFIHSMYAKK